MAMCAIVSFRLGRADGVSVVAATWRRALADLGFSIRTVAGDGPVDVTVPGLAIDAASAPTKAELHAPWRASISSSSRISCRFRSIFLLRVH